MSSKNINHNSNDQIHVVIRTDSSFLIGAGHVMRCLALAEELKKRHADVLFICRALPGNYNDLIVRRGFNLVEIPLASTQTERDFQLINPEQDAEETLAILNQGKRKCHWLIVDHYSLGKEWEMALRPLVERIFVIDDFLHREHSCDLFLNQNITESLVPTSEIKWKGSATVLLGPHYALLDEQFKRKELRSRKRDGTIHRVLLFFGGSDLHGLTERVLAWIIDAGYRFVIDVVVGSSNQRKEVIEQTCKTSKDISFYLQVDNMAERFACCDLAIGASGSSSWERCSLGVPSIVIGLAENQKLVSEQLSNAGAAIYLGFHEQVKKQDLITAVNNLSSNAELTQNLSKSSQALVDSYGTQRISTLLLPSFRINILSDKESWINDHLLDFITTLKERGHEVSWYHDHRTLNSGDFLFILSYSQIIQTEILRKHLHNLVVHESALPQGRGMSPLTWQILEGKNTIPITLFEADSKLDSGSIYLKAEMQFQGGELVEELRNIQAHFTKELCLKFLDSYPDVVSLGEEQRGTESRYRSRVPEDSRLDPDRSIREQFNLLRVADNQRYPAFFELNGRRYRVEIFSEIKP